MYFPLTFIENRNNGIHGKNLMRLSKYQSFCGKYILCHKLIILHLCINLYKSSLPYTKLFIKEGITVWLND